jgi:hydrogenase nickel incorporation protein HypB
MANASAQTERIPVDFDLRARRQREAEAARAAFTARGTLVVNLVSSPGAGKTSLLEATARRLQPGHSLAVLVGDIATERDAERLRPWVDVVQLTTGGACHLELPLVQRGLSQLPRSDYEFLFIENIGNLVCPASHDLAEHRRVVLVSTTEGDDKPGKYPKMFRTSDAMVITKCDLLPHVPFETRAVTADAHEVRGDLVVLETSVLNAVGIDAWCDWLVTERQRLLDASDPAQG